MAIVLQCVNLFIVMHCTDILLNIRYQDPNIRVEIPFYQGQKVLHHSLTHKFTNSLSFFCFLTDLILSKVQNIGLDFLSFNFTVFALNVVFVNSKQFFVSKCKLSYYFPVFPFFCLSYFQYIFLFVWFGNVFGLMDSLPLFLIDFQLFFSGFRSGHQREYAPPWSLHRHEDDLPADGAGAHLPATARWPADV